MKHHPGAKVLYPGLGRFRVSGNWYGGRAVAVVMTRLEEIRWRIYDLFPIRMETYFPSQEYFRYLMYNIVLTNALEL